ncbi:hypothetical protein G9C98_000638 [Cotesia typhae]|uniref:Uncharacterized protein n=1 Tax=Cotesia typhae TaxID=2053667 RepID=A0A8J5RHB6_9HYME|nr:hypothetical protein G9C98_000638 [Cotesia typhae]
MLAAPFCRELQFGNMLTSRMQSHVPRCLFGSPNPKDSVELLQESLDMERSKFERRWGIDPCQEDKENVQRKFERSPRKNRSSPYSRQTCIHVRGEFVIVVDVVVVVVVVVVVDDAPRAAILHCCIGQVT